jgi:glyoxylase-like metal-dependent hydrolase (beta-lactamase superfamily II)
MTIQIFGNIYRIELPIPFPLQTTNVYLIDASPRTLVDTGIKTEASFAALDHALKDLGFGLDSIQRILITHGHMDHYGQARRLSSLTGAPIYMHSKDYGRIRSSIHLMGPLKSILRRNGIPEHWVQEAVRFIESAATLADPLEEVFFLEEGEAIPFESMAWRTLHCPGHSPGLLCFYWPEKNILFSGDHLLKEITPNPVLNVEGNRHPFRYPSLIQYLRSLEKVRQLDISLILPGHGEEVTEAEDLIQKILRHHGERMERVLAVLKDGEKTPFEIAMSLFPGVPPFEIFLGISEAVGHLEILKKKGMIRRTERDGKDYYGFVT